MRISIIGLVLIMFFACKSKKSSFIKSADDLITIDSRGDDYKPSKCNDPMAYVPYTEDSVFWDTKYIRINFHIMDRLARDQNFKEGSGDAEVFIMQLVRNANKRVLRNHKMNLPEGNNTPQLVPRYQYVMVGSEDGDDGIYYHYDDELYYFLNKGRKRNNYKRDVIEKYAINSEEIINIFLLPHHPDSVVSKTYKQKTAGIALGTDVKLGAEFNDPDKPWNYATLLNHEIGHVLSLRHSWVRNDGCDDTPKHANCFTKTGKEPCDGAISNNMMDYNSSQMAISPCQIGKMNRVMHTLSAKQRKLVIPNWCDFDPDYTLDILDSVEWNGARDFNKTIRVLEGGVLTINCRVSMASGSKIVVAPGGFLHLNSSHLHNDCGEEWEGIEIIEEKNRQGKVIYSGEVKLENIVVS